MSREAMKLALDYLDGLIRGLKMDDQSDAHQVAAALREALAEQQLSEPCRCGKQTTAWCMANTCNKAEQPAQQEPVQVSPLEFVTMTLEKEHLVGRPIIWAQWPNEEKNT